VTQIRVHHLDLSSVGSVGLGWENFELTRSEP
jgi:hypothetical protein